MNQNSNFKVNNPRSSDPIRNLLDRSVFVVHPTEITSFEPSLTPNVLSFYHTVQPKSPNMNIEESYPANGVQKHDSSFSDTDLNGFHNTSEIVEDGYKDGIKGEKKTSTKPRQHKTQNYDLFDQVDKDLNQNIFSSTVKEDHFLNRQTKSDHSTLKESVQGNLSAKKMGTLGRVVHDSAKPDISIPIKDQDKENLEYGQTTKSNIKGFSILNTQEITSITKTTTNTPIGISDIEKKKKIHADDDNNNNNALRQSWSQRQHSKYNDGFSKSLSEKLARQQQHLLHHHQLQKNLEITINIGKIELGLNNNADNGIRNRKSLQDKKMDNTTEYTNRSLSPFLKPKLSLSEYIKLREGKL